MTAPLLAKGFFCNSGIEVIHRRDVLRASYKQANPMVDVKDVGYPANTLALMVSFNPLTKQLTWRS